MKKYPKCGKMENQIKAVYNKSGSQRCKCKECGIYYTIEPKRHEYREETRQLAFKMHFAGVSARTVGKILQINKSNVINWIKKSEKTNAKLQTINETTYDVLELDELYCFLGYKPCTETRENVYVMIMASRNLGYIASTNKASETIQRMVDAAPEAECYCTDGYFGYLNVIFPEKHVYNPHNKNDTYTVEGVNADLRHYIPTLARRGRCFPRKLENFQAVLDVFVQAYKRFGSEKMRFHSHYPQAAPPFSI